MDLLVRCVLVAVFAVAAWAKLTDRAGLRRAIVEFGLPAWSTAPLGWLLVCCECAVAGTLAVPGSAPAGALGALGLLLAFCGLIALNLSRGRRPACHCFGGRRSRPVSWSTVARNTLLATLAGFIAARGAYPWIFAALGLTAATVWLAFEAKPSGELRPGMAAPAFSLTDQSGQSRTLRSLLVGPRPLLLLFSDHACGACNALLPEVARWQDAHSERMTVAVVSGGPQQDGSAAHAHGLRLLLADPDRAVLAAYGISATPSAVLIDGDGIVVARTAVGPAEITDLVEQALQPRERSTMARRALLLASATLVPFAASARSATAARLTGHAEPGDPTRKLPKQVRAGDGWLCHQRYALCTKAACVPSPHDPKILNCRCVVQDGYSFGFTSCRERAPRGHRLVSAFSTQHTSANTRALTCTDNVWANCLDVTCTVDPHDSRKAVCRCLSVESASFFTYGGDCDTSTCHSVIWSGADQPTASNEYQKAMRRLGFRVTLPPSCPTGSAFGSPKA